MIEDFYFSLYILTYFTLIAARTSSNSSSNNYQINICSSQSKTFFKSVITVYFEQLYCVEVRENIQNCSKQLSFFFRKSLKNNHQIILYRGCKL